ncbi:hypothetical protein KI387_021034, partial [Taxus chinensis]
GPPIKVPINATCEVEEPDEEFEESREEVEEELEELDGSQDNFLTTEGIDEEDDYDEIVAEMNSESYTVMTQEQTNKKEKVIQPIRKSKEYSTTIPVVARRGSPVPTTSMQK